jgi:hypothetical protein
MKFIKIRCRLFGHNFKPRLFIRGRQHGWPSMQYWTETCITCGYSPQEKVTTHRAYIEVGNRRIELTKRDVEAISSCLSLAHEIYHIPTERMDILSASLKWRDVMDEMDISLKKGT